jgi:hypothetical protein
MRENYANNMQKKYFKREEIGDKSQSGGGSHTDALLLTI